jgi:hypothetical protein
MEFKEAAPKSVFQVLIDRLKLQRLLCWAQAFATRKKHMIFTPGAVRPTTIRRR